MRLRARFGLGFGCMVLLLLLGLGELRHDRHRVDGGRSDAQKVAVIRVGFEDTGSGIGSEPMPLSGFQKITSAAGTCLRRSAPDTVAEVPNPDSRIGGKPMLLSGF